MRTTTEHERREDALKRKGAPLGRSGAIAYVNVPNIVFFLTDGFDRHSSVPSQKRNSDFFSTRCDGIGG